MNGDELFIYDILLKNKKDGFWKFVDLKPQSKKYEDLNFWVAYPDFEFYSKEKMILLVEVKGYHGFFDGRENIVAMKLKHFKSYQVVQKKENREVRVAFVMRIWKNKKVVFWETISNILNMPSYIEDYPHKEKDFETGEIVEKTEKFIFWNINGFRTDEDNLGLP